jgi:hypothetical protein
MDGASCLTQHLNFEAFDGFVRFSSSSVSFVAAAYQGHTRSPGLFGPSLPQCCVQEHLHNKWKKNTI